LLFMDKPWVRFYDEGVPSSLKERVHPLPYYLEENARSVPQFPAIIFYGKTITYGELNELVNRLANVLRKLGVKEGDKVGLFLPNTPQAIIAFYATLKLGAIVVQNNPLYTARELEYQLKDAEVETLITLDLEELYDKVDQIRNVVGLKNVIVGSLREYLPPTKALLYPFAMRGKIASVKYGGGIYAWHDMIRSAAPEFVGPELKLDDIALIQYTGATTGTAKGVMLTHHNISINAYQAFLWFKKPLHKQFLSVLPYFHIYGMTTAMNLPIISCSTMVVMPLFKPREIVEAIERYKVYFFPGIPQMFAALTRLPKIERYDLSSLCVCVSGAAPLPREIEVRFEQLSGARLIEGYGLTEASPVTHCNPAYGVKKSGSIGIPWPDTDAKIVDLMTGEEELPPGQEGELIVRGPQIMKGYWKRDDLTNAVLRDGWLYTGDIAKMDEDGFFYIVGRKKDIIIVRGYNVNPEEVEAVLIQHPKIKEAAVIGVPDEVHGEVPKAYVVLEEGVTLEPKEIINFCRERLAEYKVPKYVEYRDSLPKSIIGKVLRRKLREELTG